MRIQWRWEQFSGIAKYCVSDGMEYLVGIQRDATKSPVLNQPVPSRKRMGSNYRPVSTDPIQKLPRLEDGKPRETPAVEGKVEVLPRKQIANGTTPMPERDPGKKIEGDALRGVEPQLKRPPQERQAGKEGTSMRRKWLESALWNNKQDGLSGSSNGKRGAGEKGNSAPVVVDAPQKAAANPGGATVANCSVELLPSEDIYRAAGIMNPRKGYGINKVVEMLQSDHVRGLSKEMKRAAVLMALDAAGIPIDEVLMDARARQNALDSYEAGQKKQVEVEWARKAEENVQIQAELERVKEQYAARIGRHLNALAREKEAFAGWQTTKQREFQNMAEAAELCLRPTVSEPIGASLPKTNMAATSAKRGNEVLDPPIELGEQD